MIPRGVRIRRVPAAAIPGTGRAGRLRTGVLRGSGSPLFSPPPSVSPRSPPGPALLQGSLRLRTRKRRRVGLQGRRHHHPDQPDRRKLVRGHDQRPVGLLPPQLRGSAGSATSVKRHRSRPPPAVRSRGAEHPFHLPPDTGPLRRAAGTALRSAAPRGEIATREQARRVKRPSPKPL